MFLECLIVCVILDLLKCDFLVSVSIETEYFIRNSNPNRVRSRVLFSQERFSLKKKLNNWKTMSGDVDSWQELVKVSSSQFENCRLQTSQMSSRGCQIWMERSRKLKLVLWWHWYKSISKWLAAIGFIWCLIIMIYLSINKLYICTFKFDLLSLVKNVQCMPLLLLILR